MFAEISDLRCGLGMSGVATMTGMLRKIGIATARTCIATVPGSKSYTNRALILAAQRLGVTRIRNALVCDDTRRLATALSQFDGLHVTEAEECFIVTRHTERLGAPREPLFMGGAGTPARFLLSFAANAEGSTRITGNPRLCERPMGDLLESLASAGISCRCLEAPNRLPVAIDGGTPSNYDWTIKGTTSSQFASSLLLSAAQQRADRVSISVVDGLISAPYVNMTVAMMNGSGIEVRALSRHRYMVVPGTPRCEEIIIEPDASAMSYALTAAALTRSTVVIHGIGKRSVQGDLKLLDAYVRMGCDAVLKEDSVSLTGAPLRGIEIDMSDMPDVVLSLAVAATQADSATTITNIGSLRIKECDRIAAISNELRRLGLECEERADSVVIHPGNPRPAVVNCYDDHRVAMAFSLLGLLYDGIEVDNPGCVGKSFPNYWGEMDRLCASLESAP